MALLNVSVESATSKHVFTLILLLAVVGRPLVVALTSSGNNFIMKSLKQQTQLSPLNKLVFNNTRHRNYIGYGVFASKITSLALLPFRIDIQVTKKVQLILIAINHRRTGHQIGTTQSDYILSTSRSGFSSQVTVVCFFNLFYSHLSTNISGL